MNPQNKVLVENIEEIIENEVFIKNVPFAVDIDSNSIKEAANKIMEMLIKMKHIKD